MNISDFIAKRALLLAVICVFLAGWLSNTVYSNLTDLQYEAPFTFTFKLDELDSPSDHVKEDQIRVYQDRIEIDLEDAMWARFTDTNSMDPLFDAEANTIEIKPEKPSDINVGDIISYRPRDMDSLIVHRVVDIGNDNKGWYAVAKGDNVEQPDPDKIRFDQVNGVLVAIIY
ncbi:hypothetical protein KY343_01035 [Candidatus Woesearchaeota archaeon]|nr:hypothetical protein [Candidatus Woesearchaeota archaeon]